jgi:hypothetical protein
VIDDDGIDRGSAPLKFEAILLNGFNDRRVRGFGARGYDRTHHVWTARRSGRHTRRRGATAAAIGCGSFFAAATISSTATPATRRREPFRARQVHVHSSHGFFSQIQGNSVGPLESGLIRDWLAQETGSVSAKSDMDRGTNSQHTLQLEP